MRRFPRQGRCRTQATRTSFDKGFLLTSFAGGTVRIAVTESSTEMDGMASPPATEPTGNQVMSSPASRRWRSTPLMRPKDARLLPTPFISGSG